MDYRLWTANMSDRHQHPLQDNDLHTWWHHGRLLYAIQLSNSISTLIRQKLRHWYNQSIHLYLESCSKSSRADVHDQLLNHDKKRNLIEQRNFSHRLPSAIKSIFLSTDKENEKKPDNSGKKEVENENSLPTMIKTLVNKLTTKPKNFKNLNSDNPSHSNHSTINNATVPNSRKVSCVWSFYWKDIAIQNVTVCIP